MRGKTIEVVCACGCKRKFTVRVADRKRGWGKYASKSCKAVAQERRTGQMAAYLDRQRGHSAVSFESDAERESIQWEKQA